MLFKIANESGTFNPKHTIETTKKKSAIFNSAFTCRFKIKNDFKKRGRKEKRGEKKLNLRKKLFSKH